jgi:PAS domain S-box-containing protein
MKIDHASLHSFCLDSVIDPHPLKVNAQTTVRQAIQLMNQTQKSCVLVMSNLADDSSFLGTFTEKDVMEFVANHQSEQDYNAPISQMIRSSAIVISQAEAKHLPKILEKINQYQLRYLPVLNLQEQVVGLITLERLLHQLTHSWNAQSRELHEFHQTNTNDVQYLLNPQNVNIEGYESRLFRSFIEDRFLDLVYTEVTETFTNFTELTPSVQEVPFHNIALSHLLTEPPKSLSLEIENNSFNAHQLLEEEGLISANILNVIQNAVIVTDTTGNIIYFNKSAQSLYQWEPEQILHQPWNQVLFSQKQQKLITNIFQSILKTGSWEGSLTLQPQPHLSLQVLAQFSLLKNSQNEPIGTVGFFTHIEQWSDTEPLLIILDSSGIITSISEHTNQIFGYKPTQLIGKSFLDFVSKKSPNDFEDWLLNSPLNSKEIKSISLLKSTNQTIDCIVSAKSLFQQNHQLQNILITLVTSQKSQNNERITSEKLINLLPSLQANQLACNHYHSFSIQQLKVEKEPILNRHLIEVKPIQQKFQGYTPVKKRIVPSRVTFTHKLTQKLIENQFSESVMQFQLNLLQKFSEITPQIVYVYDLKKQKNIYVNHRFTELFGYSSEVVQSAGNHFFIEKIHPDDLAKLDLQMQRFATAQDHEVMELEYRLQHANGNWRWLLGWEMIFSRDPSGVAQQIVGIVSDITTAKETEAALKQSEERYRLIAENSTDLITRHSLEGICLYVSPACRTLLGYEPEELIGHAAYSKFHRQDRHLIEQAYTAILEGAGMQTVCYRIRHKQGHYIWLETNAHAIFDPENGLPIAIIETSRDISERKRSEEELRLSQARLQSILNSLQDIVWSADFRTHQLLYINPVATQIYERPLSDFFNHPNLWLEVIYPEDRERVEAYFHQVFNAQLMELEYRILRPSGEIRWIRDRSWIVYDSAGQPIRKDGLATDITENKRIEEALRLTQQKLEYLLCSNPAVIYSSEAFSPYAVKFISQNVTRILGYPPQFFIENPNFWYEHIHPEDVEQVLSQLPKIFAVSAHLQIDYRFLIQEGSYRWIRDERCLIRDPNNQPIEIVGYLADITPQKIAEEETYKALAKAQELSQLRSRFITLTSHEFRTPLCTILSSADLLEFYTEQQAIEKQKEHIQRIQNAALHLTNLLSDILTFSHANVDQLECYPEALDLEMFCRQLIKEISMSDQYQHPIHFVSNETFITPYLDQKLLRYILTNLLSNAVKYSPPGSPIFIEVSIQSFQKANEHCFLNIYPNQNLIVFKIQDQGIGILPEDQSQIFDSFYRGKNLENQSGVGLGLAIVKKAIEAHGGCITFETHIGIGTTFTVALPWMDEEQLLA